MGIVGKEIEPTVPPSHIVYNNDLISKYVQGQG